MRTSYVGRLAPSPTGLLHLGHAATFWTADFRARGHNGTLLLRNEDLDPQRSKQEFVDAMLEDLAWLGIEWTPPMIVQSQRLALYREAFEKLLATGHAYPCTCSRRELAQMMQAPHEDTDDEPVYTGKCRPTSNAPRTLQSGMNYRFRVPDGEAIRFIDGNMGAQQLTTGKDFGDFLVWRKDGLPSYQLACVVDDAAMRITEVVRGADLLKSTARQILLQRALSLPAVAYFHTRLLVDEHGTRLAKRHGALAIHTLRQRGLKHDDVLAMLQA
ncbi:tRNA glutamyl-Q(34) synthetase GluQRS [Edaphobacter bradus]|uniref:tRNA glutamyl-Q(34) synthetase GluQRS n=1 Tax=Edaphobacter bradus TaxID=2259016 RepID=UPI0021E07AC5|nr:tRNA glutamyl-Q(34) synthetase GluQRS [Edaphobacter bradus]